MIAFSDYFINNFFLSHMLNIFCMIWNTDTDLIKISVQKTFQLISAFLSEAQISEQVIDITQQLSNLWQDCFIWNCHKCVISCKFDIYEIRDCVKHNNNNTKDNNSWLLKDKNERSEYLEVAYILSHSLILLAASDGDS